jgi:glycosyltransferase involved in cell wall biosynthesis
MSVSVILPCYNPQPGWEQVICADFKLFAARVAVPVELILVLDGVPHKRPDIVAALSVLSVAIPDVTIIRYDTNRGKGYATRKGVEAAKGAIVIYTDVDFPYNTDSDYYAHVPMVRRLISRILRFFIRLFLSMPVTDTQCGLKGMRRSATDVFLSTTIDRYLFDLEFIYKCFRGEQLRVQAVPVRLKEEVQFRKMDYRILLPEMVNFIRLVLNKN